MVSVLGIIAEFKLSLILESRREGVANARQKGIHCGRKRSLSDMEILLLQQRVQNGEKKAKIAKEFGISRQTLYEYIRLKIP